MKVLNDILGYNNLKIYQDNTYFCFSLDSVILANYVNIRLRDNYICDLCTGNGVVPLILSKRTNKKIFGVEIQKSIYDLAMESVKINNLEDRITLINCDISDKLKFNYNEYFDLVTCNPPYFKLNENSLLNENIEKQIARHELKMDLDSLFSVSKRILKNGGNLVLVHRTSRLMEILEVMKKYNIEPKRLKFIYENINKESNLVLIEGQKLGHVGLKIDNPLIMYNLDSSMTDEYLSLTKEVRK